MNKKIRKFMERAIISIDGQTFGKTYIPDEFTEKFAELIVEECASICEISSIPIDIATWQNSTKKEMTAIMSLELAKLIRKTFGVENE